MELRTTETEAPTPMHLLSVAMSQNADIEKLQKLMELQERWEASHAKKAFQSALAAFKADPPRIFKNKHVSFTTSRGKTEYDHATLDEVALTIGESLSRHGLSFRWGVDQVGKIRVTCYLQHELGHSEQVSMEASPDESGGKNSIQAVGSTVTYLERYTLLAITGMAVQDQDDDGEASQERILPPTWTEEDRRAAHDAVNDLGELLMGWGLDDSAIKTETDKVRFKIGDRETDFHGWSNRLTAFGERLRAKYAPKPASASASASAPSASPEPSLEVLWASWEQAQIDVTNKVHLRNRQKKLIAETFEEAGISPIPEGDPWPETHVDMMRSKLTALLAPAEVTE